MIFEEEIVDRFLDKSTLIEDCYIWKGPFHKKGYGIFSYTWKGISYQHLAHRYAYALATGNISDELETHHSCERPECVNPEHLLQLTRSEHKQRHASDYCGNGHQKVYPNISFDGSCRVCNREWMRDKYKRRKR